MKKFIYAIGLILAGGLVANAATPQAVRIQNSQPNQMSSLPMIQKAVKLDASETNGKKKAKRASSTVEDYVGDWQWSGTNQLDGISLPSEGVLTISVSETNPEEIIITGFDGFADEFNGGLKGYFKNGRVYIPNQQTLPAGVSTTAPMGSRFTNWSGRVPTDAEWETLKKQQGYTDEERPYVFYMQEAPEGYDFFFIIRDDLTTDEIIASWNLPDGLNDQKTWYENFAIAADQIINKDNSFYLLVSQVYGHRIERFEFNPVEWEYVGDAEFKDAWLAPIADLEESYDVPLMRNILNPQRFLLQDPYGPNTPWGGTGWNADEEREGYIVFDIAYTGEGDNIVIVEPFVYSVSVLYGQEQQFNEMFNYNQEAYYFYIQGQPLSKIIELLDISSWYDENANKVEIYNGAFDLVPAGGLASDWSWVDANDNPIVMEGYVILPEGVSSVDRVLGEEAEVAPVYYNLQGVRVNNPEKGQLLIVKKGDKTVKQIIR